MLSFIIIVFFIYYFVELINKLICINDFFLIDWRMWGELRLIVASSQESDFQSPRRNFH